MGIRLAAGIVLGGILVLLIVASRLNPDASGLGTHHQLGLPPCSIRMMFGIRCPSCGMTTSWAHVMNGDLISAARANLGGGLLAFYAIASIGPLVNAVRRGQFPGAATVRWATIALVGIALVTLVQWSLELLA